MTAPAPKPGMSAPTFPVGSLVYSPSGALAEVTEQHRVPGGIEYSIRWPVTGEGARFRPCHLRPVPAEIIEAAAAALAARSE